MNASSHRLTGAFLNCIRFFWLAVFAVGCQEITELSEINALRDCPVGEAVCNPRLGCGCGARGVCIVSGATLSPTCSAMPGTLGEGSFCTDHSACGLGQLCYEGVCRAYCSGDEGDDGCGQGVCVIVAEAFVGGEPPVRLCVPSCSSETDCAPGLTCGKRRCSACEIAAGEECNALQACGCDYPQRCEDGACVQVTSVE